jgi:hypothetical protein
MTKKYLPTDPDRPYLEDPELQDDSDPEYREEMFKGFQYSGLKPEDITTDPQCAKEYARWLKKNQ